MHPHRFTISLPPHPPIATSPTRGSAMRIGRLTGTVVVDTLAGLTLLGSDVARRARDAARRAAA